MTASIKVFRYVVALLHHVSGKPSLQRQDSRVTVTVRMAVSDYYGMSLWDVVGRHMFVCESRESLL